MTYTDQFHGHALGVVIEPAQQVEQYDAGTYYEDPDDFIDGAFFAGIGNGLRIAFCYIVAGAVLIAAVIRFAS